MNGEAPTSPTNLEASYLAGHMESSTPRRASVVENGGLASATSSTAAWSDGESDQQSDLDKDSLEEDGEVLANGGHPLLISRRDLQRLESILSTASMRSEGHDNMENMLINFDDAEEEMKEFALQFAKDIVNESKRIIYEEDNETDNSSAIDQLLDQQQSEMSGDIPQPSADIQAIVMDTDQSEETTPSYSSSIDLNITGDVSSAHSDNVVTLVIGADSGSKDGDRVDKLEVTDNEENAITSEFLVPVNITGDDTSVPSDNAVTLVIGADSGSKDANLIGQLEVIDDGYMAENGQNARTSEAIFLANITGDATSVPSDNAVTLVIGADSSSKDGDRVDGLEVGLTDNKENVITSEVLVPVNITGDATSVTGDNAVTLVIGADSGSKYVNLISQLEPTDNDNTAENGKNAGNSEAIFPVSITGDATSVPSDNAVTLVIGADSGSKDANLIGQLEVTDDGYMAESEDNAKMTEDIVPVNSGAAISLLLPSEVSEVTSLNVQIGDEEKVSKNSQSPNVLGLTEEIDIVQQGPFMMDENTNKESMPSDHSSKPLAFDDNFVTQENSELVNLGNQSMSIELKPSESITTQTHGPLDDFAKDLSENINNKEIELKADDNGLESTISIDNASLSPDQSRALVDVGVELEGNSQNVSTFDLMTKDTSVDINELSINNSMGDEEATLKSMDDIENEMGFDHVPKHESFPKDYHDAPTADEEQYISDGSQISISSEDEVSMNIQSDIDEVAGFQNEQASDNASLLTSNAQLTLSGDGVTAEDTPYQDLDQESEKMIGSPADLLFGQSSSLTVAEEDNENEGLGQNLLLNFDLAAQDSQQDEGWIPGSTDNRTEHSKEEPEHMETAQQHGNEKDGDQAEEEKKNVAKYHVEANQDFQSGTDIDVNLHPSAFAAGNQVLQSANNGVEDNLEKSPQDVQTFALELNAENTEKEKTSAYSEQSPQEQISTQSFDSHLVEVDESLASQEWQKEDDKINTPVDGLNIASKPAAIDGEYEEGEYEEDVPKTDDPEQPSTTDLSVNQQSYDAPRDPQLMEECEDYGAWQSRHDQYPLRNDETKALSLEDEMKNALAQELSEEEPEDLQLHGTKEPLVQEELSQIELKPVIEGMIGSAAVALSESNPMHHEVKKSGVDHTVLDTSIEHSQPSLVSSHSERKDKADGTMPTGEEIIDSGQSDNILDEHVGEQGVYEQDPYERDFFADNNQMLTGSDDDSTTNYSEQKSDPDQIGELVEGHNSAAPQYREGDHCENQPNAAATEALTLEEELRNALSQNFDAEFFGSDSSEPEDQLLHITVQHEASEELMREGLAPIAEEAPGATSIEELNSESKWDRSESDHERIEEHVLHERTAEKERLELGSLMTGEAIPTVEEIVDISQIQVLNNEPTQNESVDDHEPTPYHVAPFGTTEGEGFPEKPMCETTPIEEEIIGTTRTEELNNAPTMQNENDQDPKHSDIEDKTNCPQPSISVYRESLKDTESATSTNLESWNSQEELSIDMLEQIIPHTEGTLSLNITGFKKDSAEISSDEDGELTSQTEKGDNEPIVAIATDDGHLRSEDLKPHAAGTEVMMENGKPTILDSESKQRMESIPPKPDTLPFPGATSSIESDSDSMLDKLDDVQTPTLDSRDLSLDETVMDAMRESPVVEPLPEFTLREEMDERRNIKEVTIDGKTMTLNLAAIEPYRALYTHGGYTDEENRQAIIILAACEFPEKTTPKYSEIMDQLFIYVYHSVQQLVVEEFTIIYLQGGAKKSQLPGLKWMKRCHDRLSRSIRKSIKNLYIVHPTFWTRTAIFWSRPFISSKFSRKMHTIPTLENLNKNLSLQDVPIPTKVRVYDASHKQHR